MESFEEKKPAYTYENPCLVCGFPVDVKVHDPEQCPNAKEDKEAEKKYQKEETEKGISDNEYVKELKLRSQLPEELPTEAKEAEDLWSEEAGKILADTKKEKTPVVVETEQEKRIKKFVWDMLDKDVELKDQIVFSRGGKNEIVSNFFKRKIESKINEAVKEEKLMPEDTYNHCQKIWDELERIGDDVFIQAKGKIFLKAKE